MTDLRQHLQETWRPSSDQIKQADALVAAGCNNVVTVHLLINKKWGFWNEDIEIRPLDGVFTDRDLALRYLHDRAVETHADGTVVCGGYTYHSGNGQWAVFDDIMSCFPKEGR